MKIAIIGAGAAGCFAAANIPYKPGQEVVVFEKTGKVLQKVKVSGGGRCNVTHHLFEVPELITRYPRGKQFLKKTLFNFSPKNTVDWFEQHGVSLKTETDGRMFPITNDSQTIIDCLWQEMMKQKVEVKYHKSLKELVKKSNTIALSFADGSFYEADKVLIACGGFPKEEQYHWLTAIGHTIIPPAPSLFTFNIPKHPITELMGVAVPNVAIKIAGTKIIEQGPILITHWGVSGPVVLRSSAWGARVLQERGYDFTIQVNWLNDMKEQALKDIINQQRRTQGKQFIHQKNPFELPRRLWAFLLFQCGISEEVRWGECAASAQNKLIETLIRHSFPIKGKTTFKEEFVTCGGINLNEIDPHTVESRVVPGLHFAGEILDVDGITGGFNFQHAWASGFAFARHIQSV